MGKVIKFSEIGNEDVLSIVDEPIAKPDRGEVLIDIRAVGLNRSEIMFRQGYYIQQPEFPSKIGYEASGIITALGEGVKNWKVGDKVGTLPMISMSKYGVWADYAVVPEYAIVASPENLSFAESAAIWIAYTTAWGGLIDIGNIKSGDYVLITAATGGPGMAAIQIARRVGAIPIVTLRNAEFRNELFRAGAEHVIITSEEKTDRRIKHITGGKGVKVIFDCIAGQGIETLAKSASIRGTIVIYGMLSPEPTPFPMYAAFEKSLTVRGYTITEILNDKDRWARAYYDLKTGFNDGTLVPNITVKSGIDNIKDALRFIESGAKIGKVVVEIK
ncbi:MAG: zinc-dependent alcohol dehydrogenase family protein [Bacteroidales bacterium]|jgi:NADPH:quinone reductase-like Zn-dependent oxidoreductase|nr:zinc-dependent alcohol dehydrogenase family protein [Bacteroidales bacterium]